VKKLTSILLLFCLLFATAGYQVVLRVQVWQAKNQMKRELQNSSSHKDEITEFQFAADKYNQLEWENDHEFLFNGHMYDLISKEWKNGKLLISCISDDRETVLLNEYMKINRENQSGKKTLASLLQLICSQFVLPSSILSPGSVNCNQTKFPSYTSGLFNIAYPIHTPPPRSC
jgi:hypothetical protein